MSDEVTRQMAEASADRDVDREHYDWMVQNRNEWQKRAEALESTVNNCDLLKIEVEYLRDGLALTGTERDILQQRAEVLESSAQQVAIELTADRDNWQQRAETAERASAVDAQAIQRLTEEVHQLKDTGEQLIAECNRVSAERDAALAEVVIVTVDRDAALAEVEGLRADLLAHPPELHQELAIERKRHLELLEDYDRREVVITILEDELKRAENALKVAQAKHIDDRLKGFLAVISQLADQAQELLP